MDYKKEIKEKKMELGELARQEYYLKEQLTSIHSEKEQIIMELGEMESWGKK